MGHSKYLKNAVVAKVTRGEMTPWDAEKAYGIRYQTVKYWIQKEREDGLEAQVQPEVAEDEAEVPDGERHQGAAPGDQDRQAPQGD